MSELQMHVKNYLEYCQFQKRLDEKTLKAYRIDLTQFINQISVGAPSSVTQDILEDHIAKLHQKYKPRTVKRKLASLKAFFRYLQYRELIGQNPFGHMQIKFREPVILPKTIPLPVVEAFLSAIYSQNLNAKNDYQRKNSLRDAAVIELLFATGMRISELCSLKARDVNLSESTILIHGKGSKERRIQIGNKDVADTLKKYHTAYEKQLQSCQHFFTNQNGSVLSDQAVRRMINKYTSLAAIDLHITPHMFRNPNLDKIQTFC